jgi:CRISPR-associated protein Cas2
MALNERRTWLIAYDIRDDARLRRVHRYVKSRALPVQYSVYVADASATQIRRVHSDLARLVDQRVDDVRIYQLPTPGNVATLGRPLIGDGLRLLTGTTLDRVIEGNRVDDHDSLRHTVQATDQNGFFRESG